MLLALDYDETYTRDKIFWDKVIELATMRGHSVICVTMRSDDVWEAQDVIYDLGGKVEHIIFTNRKAKAPFVAKLGYNPDVWIDDNPLWVLKDAG